MFIGFVFIERERRKNQSCFPNKDNQAEGSRKSQKELSEMSSRHYKSISGDDITIDISAIGHSRGDDKTNVINHNNRNPLTVTQSRIFLVSLAMNVMLLFVIFYERGWSQQVVIDCNVQLDSASEELKFAAELSANPILLKCPAQDCDCASKGEEVNDNEMSIATLTEDAVYESEAYQKVTGQWKHYAADMEKELKRISTELLVEKFGLPPYFVQVNLEFPSSSDSNSGSNGGDGGNSEADEVDTMSSTIVPSSSPGGNSGSILIEMAPIELVPYTVLFFLTQVSSEAWDGCSFFINLGHVVSAGILFTTISIRLSPCIGYSLLFIHRLIHHRFLLILSTYIS